MASDSLMKRRRLWFIPFQADSRMTLWMQGSNDKFATRCSFMNYPKLILMDVESSESPWSEFSDM